MSCDINTSHAPLTPDYTRKMRDVEAETVDGKRKNETLWPVMRISHTRSRCGVFSSKSGTN